MYDKDIRESLFFFLEESYGKSRILEEKVIGRARADCVLIQEDSFMGIEIKSDHDSYTRLEGQVKHYNQYFDYNMVVVGSKHAHSIESHVPDFWGIITVEDVEGKCDFYVLRQEQKNPFCDIKRKASLLWKSELQVLLKKYAFPKYQNKSKSFLVNYLLERISEEQLQRDFSHLLLERDYTIFSVEGKGSEDEGVEEGAEEATKGKKSRKKKYKRRKTALTKKKLKVTHLIHKRKKRTVKNERGRD